MDAEVDAGQERSGLVVVFWAWLVETVLSTAVHFAYASMLSRSATSSARWLGLVGAASSLFFVLFAVALSAGAFLLARASKGGQAFGANVAAGSLYALHAALIFAQALTPFAISLTGPERAVQVTQALGIGLAVVRLAAWGALAVGIYAVGVERGRPVRDAVRIAMTVAFSVAVAVVVASVALHKNDETWRTLSAVMGLAANVTFLAFVVAALRASPKTPVVTGTSSWASAARGLRIYGAGVLVRGALLFVILGVGATAGLGGLAVVGLVALPLLSAVGGVLPAVGIGLFARTPPPGARGASLTALALTLVGIAGDVFTSWTVFSAIDRWKSGGSPVAPAIGGLTAIAGFVATVLFVFAQRRAAGSVAAADLVRLATGTLAGLGITLVVAGSGIALVTLAEKTVPGLALLAVGALVGLASVIALVVLTFELARHLVAA